MFLGSGLGLGWSWVLDLSCVFGLGLALALPRVVRVLSAEIDLRDDVTKEMSCKPKNNTTSLPSILFVATDDE